MTRRRSVAGPARHRTLLRTTAAGRRTIDAWLDRPVDHLRDVRTELLLKLAFRRRAGLDNAPLLRAQRDALAPAIAQLATPGAADDVVDLWRREGARAVRRFLDDALDPERAGSTAGRPTTMRLSARNQLHGEVVDLGHGEVMSTVRVALPDGQQLTAAITKDAAVDLDLVAGDAVLVIVKSTEVMIGR